MTQPPIHMIIQCPYSDCTQQIAIDTSYADTEASCPTCGKPFICPGLEEFPPEERTQKNPPRIAKPLPKVGNTVQDNAVTGSESLDESISEKSGHVNLSCLRCERDVGRNWVYEFEDAMRGDLVGMQCPECGMVLCQQHTKEVVGPNWACPKCSSRVQGLFEGKAVLSLIEAGKDNYRKHIKHPVVIGRPIKSPETQTKNTKTDKDSLHKAAEKGEKRHSMKIGNLEVMDKDLDPEFMLWADATRACQALGGGWRLPTKDELTMLYKNRDLIGGFSAHRCYWSSSKDTPTSVWVRIFDDRGIEDGQGVFCEAHVRPVRTTQAA